ncbi:transposase [Candidatus Bathyarchaeota archaeon]|nr:transposase [Candidatus Bathyarchaeota archaeon]
MILTYNVKHGSDFSEELQKAKRVASYAVEYRSFTSRDVKHIGLKSMIANQILRKYGRNRTVKKVKNVNLTIPSQGIKVDHDKRVIAIPCLKLSIPYRFQDFEKVNQIEVDDKYAHISVSVPEKETVEPEHYIGVDLNTTGHIAVASNPLTGKVWKLGKQAEHIHKKYMNIRRRLQTQGRYRLVKQIKNRESHIVRDLNHKISKKLVGIAASLRVGIKLERLEGIRKNCKQAKSFRYSLNSWSFYQLQQFIEYKAKLQGVTVAYTEPAYTSQMCSRCGRIGDRSGKGFKCPHCGHVENADVNASFNIALHPIDISQFSTDRDVLEGCIDTPQEATSRTAMTLESPDFKHINTTIPHMLR